MDGSHDIRVDVDPNQGQDDGGPEEYLRRAEGICSEDRSMNEWLSMEGEEALHNPS